ncbi:Tigger transposable element-derived protein 4 [Cucumispora dikerogammari]|nr:Tigger transposable element-derived protein 4 [Cucumispora dikerogammari]
MCILKRGKVKIIGYNTAQNPLCIKDKNINNLESNYISNKRAWMNSFSFKKQLGELNKKFKTENRKILLLLDNDSVHSGNAEYSHVQLLFFAEHYIFNTTFRSGNN